MLELPSVAGPGWSQVRAIAGDLAGQVNPDEVGRAAVPPLDASQDAKRRMLGMYLLGFTALACFTYQRLLKARWRTWYVAATSTTRKGEFLDAGQVLGYTRRATPNCVGRGVPLPGAAGRGRGGQPAVGRRLHDDHLGHAAAQQRAGAIAVCLPWLPSADVSWVGALEVLVHAVLHPGLPILDEYDGALHEVRLSGEGQQ